VRAAPGAYTAWLMLVGGAPIYLGALVLEDFTRLAEVGARAALATAYTVLLAFAWAHWAWIKLATTVSVTVFSLSMLTVPVVGVLSGMLFLGERPGWNEVGALAFVLGSLLSVALPERGRG
jgi:drug/metabolite transporter (DMT)-like permease